MRSPDRSRFPSLPGLGLSSSELSYTSVSLMSFRRRSLGAGIGLALTFLLGSLAISQDGASKKEAQGDAVILQEQLENGTAFEVDLALELSGELRIQADKELRKIAIKAQGKHHYTERLLSVGETPHSTGPARVARQYDKAEAVVFEGAEKTIRSLRPSRRLFLVQRTKEQLWTVCPEGPLTRSEQELTTDQFDTLALSGIVPGTKVRAGETWRLHNATVQLLCHFEGLVEQDLAGKLLEIKGDEAHFSVSGKASGIDLGAQVKAAVEARGIFDTKQNLIVNLEWKQTEERDPGPVNPSGTLESYLKVQRKKVEIPAALSDKSIAKLPEEKDGVPEQLRTLEFRDAKARYELVHGREWQLVAETDNHLVLRLLDRGDFIAQCTITPWTAATKGKHMSPEDFRAAMNKTPGWEVNKELLADEIPGTEGRYIFRIAAQGQMDGADVVQHFFLIAAPTGEQAIMTFSMTPRMVEKLGARDLSLVGGLLLPANSVEP